MQHGDGHKEYCKYITGCSMVMGTNNSTGCSTAMGKKDSTGCSMAMGTRNTASILQDAAW